MPSSDRYKFFEEVWSDDYMHTQRGMIRDDMQQLLTTDYDIIYTIPQEHEYRPDLIAEKFFGNPKLYWVLVYINNFANCPEDFTANTSIRIPRYERVVELL
jgi:hypothetical protein